MTASKSSKIGGLLLAAGGSSRLGRPKQLVQYQGETLIRRSTKAIIDAGCSPVIVVIGGEIEGSTAELNDLPVQIVLNPEWRTGMSSSIASGIRRLIEIEPQIKGVLITLCDQPDVTAHFLACFINQYSEEQQDIIATDDGEVIGVPALFSARVFDQLLSLEGDKGARQLIRNSDKVATIRADAVFSDVDTQEDLVRLQDD